MGLLDLFRPKHKHSRVEVRLEAVRQLDEDELDTLIEVARRDPEAKVREAALRKLSDPALLAELAGTEPSEALKGLAHKRASELSLRRALESAEDQDAVAAVERITEPRMLVDIIRKATSSAARHRALLRLEDPRALAEVAQKADDPQMRAEALAKINDPKALRDLALHEATRAVQLLAIERLADPAALRAVAERGRSKAVRQAAKAKLTALGAPLEGPREAKGPRQKKIDPGAEARLKQRKAEAEMRRRAEEDRKNAVQEKKARLEQEHMERLRRLEADEATRAQRPAEAQVPADAPAAAIARPPREEDPERAARRKARDAEKAEREAEKARKQAARAEKARENALALESLTARLEALGETTSGKDAVDLLKEAQGSQATRGPLPDGSEALRARFEAARKQVASRLNELRETEDWRRWGNVPKLEALIVRAESLAKVVIGAIPLEDGQELDARKVQRELKAMQQEWKSHGRPPKEKADQLWERFKAACDIIYEGNKKGLDALDEERQANLKMKQELCDKVEALVASAETQANAKAISDQIKQLQEDWKKIGPVPKADNDAIWQRFRTTCDQFFASRKESYEKQGEERAANLDKQLQIVAQAEALRDSTDWKGTADKLKDLQDRWKQIGPGKKAESDEAWKKFRAACDHFFERRKAHFGEQDEERQKNLEKKEALVGRAEALAQSDDNLDPDVQIRELMAEWKKIGPVAKDRGDEVWARFGKALDALRAPAAPPPEVLAQVSGANFASTALADKLRAATAPAPPEVSPPAPTPAPKPEVPAPAPTPKPEVPAPAPAPAPEIPTPTPAPKPETPVPPPSPPAEVPTPTQPPAPAPAPVEVPSPTPAPAQAPTIAQDAWPAPEAWTLPDDKS